MSDASKEIMTLASPHNIVDISGTSGGSFILSKFQESSGKTTGILARNLKIAADDDLIILDQVVTFDDIMFLIQSLSRYTLKDAKTCASISQIDWMISARMKDAIFTYLDDSIANLKSAREEFEKVPISAIREDDEDTEAD